MLGMSQSAHHVNGCGAAGRVGLDGVRAGWWSGIRVAHVVRCRRGHTTVNRRGRRRTSSIVVGVLVVGVVLGRRGNGRAGRGRRRRWRRGGRHWTTQAWVMRAWTMWAASSLDDAAWTTWAWSASSLDDAGAGDLGMDRRCHWTSHIAHHVVGHGGRCSSSGWATWAWATREWTMWATDDVGMDGVVLGRRRRRRRGHGRAMSLDVAERTPGRWTSQSAHQVVGPGAAGRVGLDGVAVGAGGRCGRRRWEVVDGTGG